MHLQLPAVDPQPSKIVCGEISLGQIDLTLRTAVRQMLSRIKNPPQKTKKEAKKPFLQLELTVFVCDRTKSRIHAVTIFIHN